MPYTTIIFYVLAALIIISAVVVVFKKNIIHSAFSLFFTLFGIAGIYVLLQADFIAITQIMVYVGGILILLIFGVMLTTKISEIQLTTRNMNVIPSVLFTLVIIGLLMYVIFKTHWFVPPHMLPMPESTIKEIGNMLLTNYLLPFEIASLVLLVALIGAAMFARKIKD